MGLALHIRYQSVKTKHDCSTLLEITFAEENQAVTFNVWGQLAEDRVKFGLREGGVCVIANAALSQDKFFRPVLQGDIVAYTHISDANKLDWLLPNLQSIASHVGTFQEKCNELVDLAKKKLDLSTLRAYWHVGVVKKNLRDISKVRKASLFTITGKLRVIPALPTDYLEVDFIDDEDCKCKLVTSSSSLIAQLLESFDQFLRADVELLAVELVAVAVGYAYYKSIKRLIAGEHSKVTILQDLQHADSPSVPLSLSSAARAPTQRCEDYPEDALEYVTWYELLHQISTNTLCRGEEQESRKLVYLSLREVGIASVQNVLSNLIIEEVSVPAFSLSARSQADGQRCVHVAYRNALFAFSAPSASFPINEVTTRLMNELELEVETNVQTVLWHDEMVHAMLRYAHNQVFTQVVTHTQCDETLLHCVADDRALASVLDNLSAEEVYQAMQSNENEVLDQYTGGLQGLVDSAAQRCNFLVVLRCAVSSMSQDCLTESLSLFVEHIY
eukprot:gene35103-42517_t